MRRTFLLIASLAVLLLFHSVSALAADTAFISAGGGLFLPGSDYNNIGLNDDWGTGIGANLSYTMVNEYAGFEFGLNGFNTSSLNGNDSASLGLEMLVHFHKTDVTLQPFIAFGFGRYSNSISSNTYPGGGAVLKFGARYYLAENFYVSAYFKHFSNKIDMSFVTYDLGGEFLGAELGIVRF